MANATITRRNAGRMPVAPARKMGNWKMAYADFLTALMAFFLIMWLISGVSPEERTEIAGYFNDSAMTGTLSSDASAAPPLVADRMFSALSLKQELQDAGNSVILTRTADAIRIDLVDRAGRPLFDTGNGQLTPTGRRLTTAIGKTLSQFPLPVSIEGHTDAFSSANVDYTNWELSSDRANEARRLLTDAGIAGSRVRAVTGMADTTPLDSGQPHLSANRRVSILVHIDR